jgi:hypothetical protein
MVMLICSPEYVCQSVMLAAPDPFVYSEYVSPESDAVAFWSGWFDVTDTT